MINLHMISMSTKSKFTIKEQYDIFVKECFDFDKDIDTIASLQGMKV